MSNEPSESETIVAKAIAEGDVASVEQILKSTSDNPFLPYGRNVLHNEGILEELDLSTKTNANVEQLPSAKTLSSSLTSVWASVSSISSGLKNAAKSVMNPQTERVDDRRQLLGKMKKE